MNHNICVIAAALTMSACGGSGDSDLGLPVEPFTLDPLDPFVTPAGPAGYIALTNEFVAIYEGLPALVVTDMPNAGVANFEGTTLVVRDDLPGGYLGDFEASVNFRAQEFSGTADNFYYDPNEDETAAGTGTFLPSSQLNFVESGVTVANFEVAVTGTLAGNTVNGAGEVVFLGTSAEGLLGYATATSVTADDTSIAIVADR